MQASTLAALQEARTRRRAVALATRLSDASEGLVYRDAANGALAADAAIVTAARRPSARELREVSDAVRQVKERHPDLKVCACMGLLDDDEASDRARVFDIPLLAGRLDGARRWLAGRAETRSLPLGYFGASTGAAAALVASAGAEIGRAHV